MLRLQLELSQAKGELERRLQEKEEETEAARYHSFLHLFTYMLHRPTSRQSCSDDGAPDCTTVIRPEKSKERSIPHCTGCYSLLTFILNDCKSHPRPWTVRPQSIKLIAYCRNNLLSVKFKNEG